jgi:hypothetical protein
VTQQHQHKSDKPYKEDFVCFVRSKQWHWFITVPIGLCDSDNEVLKRLRTIEAAFCGKYLVNRYQKLSDEARFCMAVAFEGDAKRGDRHAHILVYIPRPSKRPISQSMMIGLFPGQFRFLWTKMRMVSASNFEEALDALPVGRHNVWSGEYRAKNLYCEGHSPSGSIVVTV